MTAGPEAKRLKALDSYAILDTAAEPAFDRLTELAADMFDAPVALVSLVDAERQWFKSRHGLSLDATPRHWAFCNHTILQAASTTMVVEDASLDPRFATNPLVTGESHFRFYAGAVLTGSDGDNLGTLCVIDTKARPAPSKDDLRRLRTLADLVVDELELRRTRRLLGEKHQLLNMAEQMSGVGRWRLVVATNHVTWSDEVYRIHGVSPDTFDPDYDGAVDFYHPDDQVTITGLIGEAIQTGGNFDCELRIRRPDGELRDVVCRAACTLGDTGVVEALYGVFQDVTDQNEALRRMAAGRMEYKRLTDGVGDIICSVRLDGTTRYASPAIGRLLGYQPEEMITAEPGSLIYEPDRPLIGTLVMDMAAGAEERTVQYRALHKEGHPVWVETCCRLARDEAGEPLEIIATVRDISERKALETAMSEALEVAEEQARRAAFAEGIAGLGHWRANLRTGHLTWSPQMYAIYGLEPGSPIDEASVMGLYHPDDVEIGRTRIRNQIAHGVTTENALNRIIWPDGQVRHLLHNSRVERDAGGEIFAIVGTAQDVTEQRRSEISVADSESKYRALADNSTDILVRFGRDGIIRYISPACRALGMEPERAIGTSVVALMAPDQLAHSEAIIAGLFSGAEVNTSVRRQHKLLAADGREIWLEGSPSLVRDEAGNVIEVLTVLRDVSARQAVEQALAASESRFRNLAVNAPDMISEMSLDGTLTYVSPASVAIIGYTPEEMLGRTPFSFMVPEDAERVLAMCQKVFLSKGAVEPWAVEYRAHNKAGELIWLESKPTLVTDPASGQYTGFTDVMRDITTRKMLEADLRQAQAVAESAASVKGEFLANMSHELRTPLTSIIGFTRLAAEQSELSPLTRTYVERVSDASRALLCTVNDILDFSKLEAGQVTIHAEPVSLDRLTRATLDLFTPQAGAKDLSLTLDGGTENPVICVDPDRIRQILLNLVSNAVKFTEVGGVTLRSRYDQQAERLTVEVIDTGDGIPPEKQDSLFKRFSQVDGSLTRSHGGTGLGLAICKGLVEAMGGEIGVESRLGEGSRFWFSVPARSAELLGPSHDEVGLDERPAFIGVRVLVVDDHPANRELAKLFLAGVGAEVTEAEDGEAAVRLAADWPFDVILMDLRMPGLDGPGALRRIRAADGPNDATPILAFTADADADSAGRLQAMGFQDVVSKPLDATLLITAIARAVAFEFETEDQALG